MTTTQSQENAMTKVTIIYHQDEIRVHGAECRDVAKDRRGATTVYSMEARTAAEVAADFFEDMLNEGSMTLDDAMNVTHVLPCCGFAR